MELLESSVVRPRQARYQAALRPDNKYVCDSTLSVSSIPSFDYHAFIQIVSRFRYVAWPGRSTADKDCVPAYLAEAHRSFPKGREGRFENAPYSPHHFRQPQGRHTSDDYLSHDCHRSSAESINLAGCRRQSLGFVQQPGVSPAETQRSCQASEKYQRCRATSSNGGKVVRTRIPRS